MENENVALQAKVYLYHLNNSNKENGFKPAEGWKFSQVTEAGKAAIEHEYYPTVSAKVLPALMQDFSNNVLLYLKSDHQAINVPDQTISIEKDAEYFIAYSADRMRR